MKPSALLSTLTLVVLLLSACRKSDVVAYRVPKEKAASPAPGASAPAATLPAGHPPVGSGGAPMADTPVATATGNDLIWIAPSHWVAKPAGGMRKGSYAVNGAGGVTADLAITAFPGDVGGEMANINRWRGQVQLPPLADTAVATAVTRLEVNGLKIALVDLANPAAAAPTRLLGAIVPLGGNTWFFKLLGPDALVAQERAAFVAFLQTVNAASPATVVTP